LKNIQDLKEKLQAIEIDFDILIALNNIENTISLLIETEQSNFFAEVKTLMILELEKNISIVNTYLEKHKEVDEKLNKLILIALIYRSFKNLFNTLNFKMSLIFANVDCYNIGVNSVAEKIHSLFTTLLEIVNYDSISEENQKLFLSIISNFLIIQKKYIDEYQIRNKENAEEFKKQAPGMNLISIHKDSNDSSQTDCQNNVEIFGYSSFGSFFFNNFHLLTEELEIRELPTLKVQIMKPTRERSIKFDLRIKKNFSTYAVFLKKIGAHQNNTVLDTEYQYFLNVKLTNWKITILPLNNLKALKTCRICNEKYLFIEFIVHSYNCRERKKNINELKKTSKFIKTLNKKLRRFKK